MKKKIIISKPFIEEEKSDIFKNSVKLCAHITMENPNTQKLEKKKCYFEFNREYKKYLCDTRSDAFVMGILSSAMELGYDIEFKAPISEKLYYQLTTYYIPMVSKHNPTYPMHSIKLIGDLDNTKIENSKAVATGYSGGVDSFYTIIKHGKICDIATNKLTHIVFNSNCTSDNNEKRIKKTYLKKLEEVEAMAKEANLKTIACYNNLYEFYKFPFRAFNMFYSTTNGSIAYALQKLIKIYYISSGDPISEFSLDLDRTNGHDSQVFDVFTLSCMNTENLSFYSSGMECRRIDKIEYIIKEPLVQKYLSVCPYSSFQDINKNSALNCSICEKCLRTLTELYVCGGGGEDITKFGKAFDVNNFLKHKTKWIGRMIGLSKSSYIKDVKAFAKKNHVKIPHGSYIYAYFWYKPIKCLRKTFKNSLLARRIYYKFNLDYKLDGYRGPKYEMYKDKLKR